MANGCDLIKCSSYPKMVVFYRNIAFTWDAILEIFLSYRFHIVLIILGIILVFLPAMTSPSNLESGTLPEAVRSDYFIASSAATVALVIPVLIDMILDFIFEERMRRLRAASMQREAKVKGGEAGERPKILNTVEKLIYIIGCCASPLVAFTPRGTPNIGMLYYCCERSSIILVLGAVMLSLRRLKLCPASVVLVVLIMLGVCCPMRLLADNAVASGSAPMSYYSMATASSVINYGAGFIILINCVWNFFNAVRTVLAVQRTGTLLTEKQRNDNNRVYITGSYLFAILLGIIVYGTMSIRRKNSIAFEDGEGLLYRTSCVLVAGLCFSVANTRIVKMDVVHGLVSCCALFKLLNLWH
jgi:hypothetical protein